EELDDIVTGNRHRGVMKGWDNSARRRDTPVILTGATPTSLRRWLRRIVLSERRRGGERVVFVNAWNEWAEGTYLEPDRDFGCGWLEAVASAVDDGRSKTWALAVPLETGDDDGHRPAPLHLERQAPPASNRDPDYSWAKALSD